MLQSRLPVPRVSTVEDKMTAYLQPAALQQTSGGHEGIGTEEASLHSPATDTRLEADPVPLE